MHLAHEELCRIAKERLNADGIVIHMLLGQLKAGDIPADVRDAAIRKMVDVYFPANTVMVNGYGFDMLYAGPREALLHAVFRQNMGATHLIVGRNHAGVGDYYGPFDARGAGVLATGSFRNTDGILPVGRCRLTGCDAGILVVGAPFRELKAVARDVIDDCSGKDSGRSLAS
jgi:hypothetical protein